jgi:hypothetical protein
MKRRNPAAAEALTRLARLGAGNLGDPDSKLEALRVTRELVDALQAGDTAPLETLLYLTGGLVAGQAVIMARRTTGQTRPPDEATLAALVAWQAGLLAEIEPEPVTFNA